MINAYNLNLYDFGVRMYDPVLGRWFVQDPANQFDSPYDYCGGNPVCRIDPDGQFAWFVPVIIGAIVGGYVGYKAAYSKGFTFKDKEMWGSILGGAILGGIAGYAGASVAATNSIVGSIVGGALNGVGNGVVQSITNHDNLKDILMSGMVRGIVGAFFGAISGGVTGTFGLIHNGDIGAFMGGAISGALRTWMAMGKKANFKDFAIAAGTGGITSVGLRHLNGRIKYKKFNASVNNTFQAEGRTYQITYKQFMGMSDDYQRSKFWNREFGGILCDDGTYKHHYGTYPLNNPNGKTRLDWGNRTDFPTNAWATSHNHTHIPDGYYQKYPTDVDYDASSRLIMKGFIINVETSTLNGNSTYNEFNDFFIRGFWWNF